MPPAPPTDARTPAPIRPLDELVVNQIAAGEVIERPASVVKELVENALDAGATRITVEIEEGGRELVRVIDDGSGIPESQLRLAVAPHATSKIASAGDLEHVATMGFRGEALASIASVSRLRLRSRPAGQDAAAEIAVAGGDAEPVRPAAGSVGTQVDVRALFFNVPARRKFLRTARAESARVGEIVRRIALAHPHVTIRLSSDGTVRFEAEGDLPSRERAATVLGAEVARELIEIEHEEARVVVRGWAGLPELARPSARHLHLFLNGRPIEDRSLVHAAREGYRGLIEPSRAPTAVLYLSIDPGEVDVNVHPAKTEVRFRRPDAAHAAVRHALKQALAAADRMPELALPEHRDGGADRPGDDASSPRPRPGAAPFARRGRDAPFGTGLGPDRGRGSGGGGGIPRPSGGAIDLDAVRRATEGVELPRSRHELEGESLDAAAPFGRVEGGPRFLRVHDSFIVEADEAGLVLIDQHALHERVMFERLIDAVEAEGLARQRLLVPDVVEADAAAIEALDELADLLEALGIEAAPAGPRSVAVHAFPALLIERRVAPGEFVHELLERAGGGTLPPGREAALAEVLDMMACKAAIKAGDHLSDREIADLLRLRRDVERSGRCPHGRPTSLRLPIEELARRFGRSGFGHADSGGARR